MPLGNTLKNGDTLRVYLTVADTAARIITGPVNNSDPGNLTQPQEALFYGVLEYQNGVLSACDGTKSPCSYIPAEETFGAGTYEAVFVLHGTATTLNTYDLSVYDTQGKLLAKWDDMPRRGYAQNGSISSYATWASRDHAGAVHMERWEEHNAASVKPTPSAARQVKKLPAVKARKNGISLLIPASSKTVNIELFNAKGALVRRETSAGKSTLFIPVKSKGLYIYRINTGGTTFHGSVVLR